MADANKVGTISVDNISKIGTIDKSTISTVGGIAVPSGFTYPYNVANSCLFVSGDTTYMSYTPTAGGNQKTMTMSIWYKRSEPAAQGYFFSVLGNDWLAFLSTDTIKAQLWDATNTRYDIMVSTELYRDPSQFMNIVFQMDTTQAVASDRRRLWINNVEITLGVDTQGLNQNDDMHWFANELHTLGYASTDTVDGYIAEFVMCEGQAYTPTDFGVDTDGVWTPKDISGLTFGTRGFYLNFADAANLGNDVSGNGNDWTENNITSTNQSTDTPTNNFSTVDILYPDTGAHWTNTEGNLKSVFSSGAYSNQIAAFAPDTGKWYFEVTLTNWTGGGGIGLVPPSGNIETYEMYNYGYTLHSGGQKYALGVSTAGYTAAFGATNYLMCAVDFDAGSVWWGLNGVWGDSGDPAAGTNYAYTGLTGPLLIGCYTSGAGDTFQFNFGNPPPSLTIASGNADGNGYGNFEYAPPTGFMALCSANLQDSAGTDPVVGEAVGNEGFVITSDTYDAIVASLEALRSGWSTWIDVFKRSDSTSDWRIRFSDDSGNQLSWNLQDDKTAFVNPSTEAGTWLGWSWQVGAEYGCATGTINHTTGSDTTGAHGLGAVPEFCITKPEDQNTTDWYTYHKGLTANYNILLNSTAIETSTEYVAVDATNVTIKSAAPTGIYRYIAFVSIEGFSHFGGYTGNGVADGPFINCGFDPAIFMNKRLAVAAGSWEARELISNPSNPCDSNFRLETTDALVVSADYFDLVSNGTKIRSTGNARNNSGETYIAMAWAGQPFKYANAR